jgi:hypothetical protein
MSFRSDRLSPDSVQRDDPEVIRKFDTHRVKRAWPIALAALIAGCANAHATRPPPVATVLFCAYGGVGIVPDPLPAGYETSFASIVVAVENRGPPLSGLRVTSAALLDNAGAPLSSLRRVDHFVTLSSLASPGPSLGTFAVFLNPIGAPFGGTLPTGRTILRVRLSLDHPSASVPNRCLIELGGTTPAPRPAEGRVDGAWGT